jgi:hypothetical protein
MEVCVRHSFCMAAFLLRKKLSDGNEVKKKLYKKVDGRGILKYNRVYQFNA